MRVGQPVGRTTISNMRIGFQSQIIFNFWLNLQVIKTGIQEVTVFLMEGFWHKCFDRRGSRWISNLQIDFWQFLVEKMSHLDTDKNSGSVSKIYALSNERVLGPFYSGDHWHFGHFLAMREEWKLQNICQGGKQKLVCSTWGGSATSSQTWWSFLGFYKCCPSSANQPSGGSVGKGKGILSSSATLLCDVGSRSVCARSEKKGHLSCREALLYPFPYIAYDTRVGPVTRETYTLH